MLNTIKVNKIKQLAKKIFCFFSFYDIIVIVMSMKKMEIKKALKIIKNNYILHISFIALNLINSTVLRIATIKNSFSIAPLFVDLSFLIAISLISLLLKKENQIKYFMIMTIILTIICTINSIYYHYYSSFASISLLATAVFAADVSDAIIENVLKISDLVYIIVPVSLYIIYRLLKKKQYFQRNTEVTRKKVIKKGLLTSLCLFLIGGICMPINSWARLFKLWNREAVVMSYGIYFYQIDDLIQSITPQINNLFGHDTALRSTSEYYSKNGYKSLPNKYTNIFEGRNVIVIHAESFQTFPMKLTFNNREVTPNVNKLASEGLFFSNFYSEVGVGTSSDAEFTFNTSLMPSTKGTVFMNYFNREYISTPKLLKEKGYYIYSMHGNTGDFWNRNTMHKNLGYDKFYSKDSYIIDETIGLGLSDKSFFNQSIDIIKKVKEEHDGPFYSLLITLTNHTPFSDNSLMDEFSTSINIELDNQTITRDYLDGTIMNNYLRSIHYADDAIGEFVDKLDKEGLLDNTVLIIYGDHDARLPFNDYNLLYNYDPITDTVKTKKDEGYIEYNNYTYKLDQKVPFIIWSKDQKLSTEITMPMGMIDTAPTIGNMLGIESKYWLGNDIFNQTEDNVVTFVDGSFLTSKIYYNSPKGEIYSLNNEPISEEYVKEKIDYSSQLIDISNNIISYDLIKELQKSK